MDERPPLPRPGRCLLARIDYGHPGLAAPGWRRLDLAWQGAETLGGSPSGLVVAGAEHLLGWARTLEGGGIWERLEAQAAGPGLALRCRFPRHARELAGRLAALRAPLDRWETAADGSAPPLYLDLRGRPELLRLHLEHEWLTALAAARGGTALLRLGRLLASGPLPAGEMARALGLTSGAVRSYLTWMEDAALVRREGRAFALRHPLLASLFVPAVAPEPAPGPAAAPPAPVSPRWDPVELD